MPPSLHGSTAGFHQTRNFLKFIISSWPSCHRGGGTMKHVSGYEQHPSSEAECRPGWMFWVPPPEVGRRPGREPALQKERSNTGDTPCSHKADSLGGCWVVEAGGRGLQHVVPSARIAREGAPAQSGEESSRLVRSRSGRHSLAWLRRSGRPVLAACVHHDILC